MANAELQIAEFESRVNRLRAKGFARRNGPFERGVWCALQALSEMRVELHFLGPKHQPPLKTKGVVTP